MYEFVKIDPQELSKELTRSFEQAVGRKLHPADPYNALINGTELYYLIMLLHRINYVGSQNLLAHAKGENLDKITEFYGVKRLPPKPAITTLRFSIDQPLPFDVVIPKGTKSTPDSRVFFETTEEVRIPAGQLSVEVQAVCTQAGSIGNGYAVGQINKLASPLPYITKVENTTMSMYGTDKGDFIWGE